MTLTAQKLYQAAKLVADSGVDAWITFVRETAGGGDPILPLILHGGLTWTSALIVTKTGDKIAVLGNYDAEPLKTTGDWSEIVPYVQGIKEPLLKVLDEKIAASSPKIAVNFSANDQKADGLSHGLFLVLQDIFAGTRFEGSLVSAENILKPLRSRKVPAEIAAMKAAIVQTDLLFEEIDRFATIGITEREVFEHVHKLIAERGLGFAWDEAGDPIVNSGPDSMIGHGIPSDKIKIAEGHIFHIDLGVIVDGYSSDLQRCWYVGGDIPEDALRGFRAVHEAITAGANALKPGVLGCEVDAAARQSLTSAGFPEYLHAFGHQVGRLAHDGGSVLGPRWERYGKTIEVPIEEGEVYTLELGVELPGRGYLGLEEMAAVRPSGVEWLSTRQDELRAL